MGGIVKRTTCNFAACPPAIGPRRPPGTAIPPGPPIPPRPPGIPQFYGRIELANDLEPPVFQKFLLLPAIKSWLLEQEEVAAAMMSGSGSTFFAILRGGAGSLAQRAKAWFGQTLWTTEATLGG